MRPSRRRPHRPACSRRSRRCSGAEFRDADPVLRRSAQPRFGDYQANAAMALAKKVGRTPRDLAAADRGARSTLDDVCSCRRGGRPRLHQPHAAARDARPPRRQAAGRRRAARRADRRPGRERASSTTPRPTWPRRCTSATCAARSSATPSCGCSSSWATRSSARTTSATGARSSGCSSSTCSTSARTRRRTSCPSATSTPSTKAARAKFDGDPAFAERARQRVVPLQAGDPHDAALVAAARSTQSKRYFEPSTSGSACTLTDDDIAAESFYNPMLADVAAELEARGPGPHRRRRAVRVPAPASPDRDGEPLPLIVRKSDGGFGYEATDLAAVATGCATLGADRIVYVVGARQAQHLAMVFAVGERGRAGWRDGTAGRARRLRHRARRPTARCSRPAAGENVKLSDLLDEAVERAAAVSRREEPRPRRRTTRARWPHAGRHRRGQVRRPLQRPGQGLRLRLGPHAGLRRQHRPVPPVRPRPHPVDLPAGARSRRRRRRRRPMRDRRAGRAGAGPAAARLRRGRAARSADTLQPHRLCHVPVRAGPGLHRRSTSSARCCGPTPTSSARVPPGAVRPHRPHAARPGLGLLGIEAPERM